MDSKVNNQNQNSKKLTKEEKASLLKTLKNKEDKLNNRQFIKK